MIEVIEGATVSWFKQCNGVTAGKKVYVKRRTILAPENLKAEQGYKASDVRLTAIADD